MRSFGWRLAKFHYLGLCSRWRLRTRRVVSGWWGGNNPSWKGLFVLVAELAFVSLRSVSLTPSFEMRRDGLTYDKLFD